MIETVDTKGEDRLETTGGAHLPEIRTVANDAPWSWLSLAWLDMTRSPKVSFGYGLAFALFSALLVAGLSILHLASLSLALVAGFMLVAPLLAVGLYEASRLLEMDEPVSFNAIMGAARRSKTQLGFVGVIMMIMLLVWMELATLLFALFFGSFGVPPLSEFIPKLLLTQEGLTMLVIGSAIGGVIAFAMFAVSAVSVPMLIDRKVDAVTAMLSSIRAVKRNLWPMLIWAWAITGMTMLGIATLFVGLVFMFPLAGHGTWHAYRAVVLEAEKGARYSISD